MTMIPDRILNRLKRFMFGDCDTLRDAILDGVNRGTVAATRIKARGDKPKEMIRSIPEEVIKAGAERRRAAPKS